MKSKRIRCLRSPLNEASRGMRTPSRSTHTCVQPRSYTQSGNDRPSEGRDRSGAAKAKEATDKVAKKSARLRKKSARRSSTPAVYRALLVDPLGTFLAQATRGILNVANHGSVHATDGAPAGYLATSGWPTRARRVRPPAPASTGSGPPQYGVEPRAAGGATASREIETPQRLTWDECERVWPRDRH